MGKQLSHMQRLALQAELPAEPIPGQPIIELAGDQRVLIERHKGVTQYGCKEIQVKLSFGCVSVSGCHLELARMTKQQLVITGIIERISLMRD